MLNVKKIVLLFAVLSFSSTSWAASVAFSPNPIVPGGPVATFEQVLGTVDGGGALALPLDATFTVDASPGLAAPVVNANLSLNSGTGSVSNLTAQLFDSANALVTDLIVSVLPASLGTTLGFNEVLASGDYRIRFSGIVTGNPVLQGQINAVPIPAAVWLFGSALVGLFGIRRTQSKHA